MIHGLTVCVNYAGLLSKGLLRWGIALDKLLVVTTPADTETRRLCASHNVETFLTEAFYADGAKFNKGAAIAEAYRHLAPPDWMLFFDADITPPLDWRAIVENAGLHRGSLHGARRVSPDGRPEHDPDLAGFFHLAHVSDPNMRHDPIVDTHWYHAGNYDSTFQNRWPRHRRVWLPLTVTHHGEPGRNWCGVGRDLDVASLHAERRKRSGRWDHETVASLIPPGDLTCERS